MLPEPPAIETAGVAAATASTKADAKVVFFIARSSVRIISFDGTPLQHLCHIEETLYFNWLRHGVASIDECFCTVVVRTTHHRRALERPKARPSGTRRGAPTGMRSATRMAESGAGSGLGASDEISEVRC
jgi:hypothetical protein